MKRSKLKALKSDLFSFENKIALGYFIVGILWIQFSDGLLNSLIKDPEVVARIQMYKGWFYVAATGVLFWAFLKHHLVKLRRVEIELKKHKLRLQYSVKDKTRALDEVLMEMHEVNVELSKKNELIESKNKELENALTDLRATQEQLIHADKMVSLGVLASGISHEINNPLNFILGGATGLENYIEKHGIQDDKLDFCLKSIKTGINRASNIVSSMSQLSRETQGFDEKCDLKEIINNSLIIVNNQIKDRIALEVNLDSDLGAIKGNVGQLHQVFTNLLVNASQAIENKGNISVESELTDKMICIKISDSGTGIRKADLKKIMTPFYTTKEPGKGTGLGLSITYNIINSHNGTMEFDSVYGEGTTVTVKLPRDNSFRNAS